MQHRTEIAVIVAKLMSHYWLPDEPTALREMLGNDWIEDLEEFPLALIGDACRDYRRGERYRIRPLPGDIRRLCLEAQQAERLRLASSAHHRKLDAETLRLWDQPEYEGDLRSPQERRAAAIEVQEERYRRAAVMRDQNQFER